MKKKYLALLVGMMVIGSVVITGCGKGDEVKVVNKLPQNNTDQTQSDKETGKTDDAKLAGYIFQVQVGSKNVSVTTDLDMAKVLDELGEANSYFESASCAFKGLDKVYTYDHFRIETYPDDDKDKISSIVLLDDLIATPEGLTIGMTEQDVENTYGTDFENIKGMKVYTKDESHLAFVIQDGVVESIQYYSSVLDGIE